MGSYGKVLVVDIEATCWRGYPPSGERSDIIEIGVAEVDTRTLAITRKDSFLIKPANSKVSAFCTELTTITQDQLNKHGLPFVKAMELFEKKYGSRSKVMFSWGDYDRDKIIEDCNFHNIGCPLSNTHVNLKALFSVIKGMSRSVGAQKALNILNIKFEGTRHRGVDDAFNTAKVLVDILKLQRGGVPEKMKRKLASVQRIESIKSIDNADKLELAKVLGWSTVVPKGTFQSGDECVYFEIDSLVPNKPWSSFLFKGNDKDKSHFRVKTIRLRGQLSQGLALKKSEFASLDKNKVGDDVTSELGVEKYELKVPNVNIQKGSFPSYVPKTDEIRLQSAPALVDEIKNKNCYITQKLDGQSVTYIYHDGEFIMCSRNHEVAAGENKITAIAKNYAIEEKLAKCGSSIAIQGELYGLGIQANRMGLVKFDYAVYNVFDIKSGKYFKFDQMKSFVEEMGLKMVPVLFEGQIPNWTMEDFIAYSHKSGKYQNGHPQEGIVVRCKKNSFSDSLLDRLSFKVINNNYLLKS